MIRFRLEPRGFYWLDFQILEEDENQRIRNASFVALNGFSVASVSVPELQVDTVFLRGFSDTRDRSVWSFEFSSRENRDAAIPRILEALKEWAAGGGFNQSMQLGEYELLRVQVPPVYEF